MPKPVRPTVRSFPEVYAAVASDLMTRLGDAVAAQAGPPTSEAVIPNTNEAQIDAWNARDPKATDEAMLALARQKYQEHIQAGMPADVAQRATAEDLTHFRYGQRLKLYTYGQVGYSEQVAEAKRLAKLAARENTPNPPLPPPSMPTAALTNLTTMGMPVPSGQAPSTAMPLGQPLQETPRNSMPAPLPMAGGLDATTQATAPNPAPPTATAPVPPPPRDPGMVERPRDTY
jgi:hypothetical protein